MELKEKAVSKKQQRFFGMVRAAQKGEGSASPEVAKVAGEISKKDAKDFAKTKHKGLPEKKKVDESAAWTKKAGKNPEGGLNEKGRKSYERDNPGSDLKAPQPEGGSRKKSFCARMGGMKKKLTSSKTANDPDSRINKALRKWKCNEAVKGQDTLSRKEGAKERATEKKAHDTWKKSGVGKTKRPLYSTTRHTKGDAESYATQQKQSIKWHHKRTKGKFIPGEQPIGEELTGDLKTDAEKHRVPRGPGGNPIRIGDKVRSMKSSHPLGQLKVKYGADKVRDYYKKNKAVGESAVLDVNTKISNKEKRKKQEAELRRLLKHAIAVKRGQAESFEIDKSAHKKAQRQSKIRNLAKDNKNPNEKAAAERKLKGPKLAWEEFKKHI